jgi:hypothetical protein
MFGVISSYWDLTGYQPVEFLPCKRPKVERTDISSAADHMSVNFSSQRLVNFGGQRPLTPVNSQQAKLAKVESFVI